MKKQRKTIQVTPDTHHDLNDFRRKEETFGAAIARLIKERKEILMAWTHEDIKEAMKMLYDLDPSPEDVENVAGLIDWDCARGHEQVRQAVEEYLATKEAEDKEGIAP